MFCPMRTTIDIDDDVLQAARELAENRGTTLGRVLSELVRKALRPQAPRSIRNGVPLMPRRRGGTAKPTTELVNRLRDEA